MGEREISKAMISEQELIYIKRKIQDRATNFSLYRLYLGLFGTPLATVKTISIVASMVDRLFFLTSAFSLREIFWQTTSPNGLKI